MTTPRSALTALAASVLLAATVAGCGADPAAEPAAGPATAAPPSTPSAATAQPDPAPPADLPDRAHVAEPVGATVEVLAAPDGEAVETFPDERPSGAPLTFLVHEDDTDLAQDGWVQVHLPVRPNGSTGYVRADDVALHAVSHRLEMSTARNELTLLEDGEPVRTMPAASGTGDTPTPLGTFYLTELLEPTNEGYGPYAYGLSAHSEVLTSFGGGPGQIGLHGTDDAGSVGRAVSHGCIRLSNEDITYLAGLLPLGTPVVVT
jgi:lipoprotein-anchoring transpeptidase ErfK/SrfK